MPGLISRQKMNLFLATLARIRIHSAPHPTKKCNFFRKVLRRNEDSVLSNPYSPVISMLIYLFICIFVPMLSITPVMLGSAVSIMTRSGDEVREIVVRYPTGARDIGPKEFRPMHMSTKPLIQWLPLTISRGQSDWSVKLNTQ